MKRTIKNLLFITFIAFGLCACSDNDLTDGKDLTTPAARYAYGFFDAQDSLSFSLMGITSGVDRVESPFSWLTIAQDGTDDAGFSRIKVSRTAFTPTRFESDSARIYLTDKSYVRLVINRNEDLVRSGTNSPLYDDFNKAWWEQDEVLYQTARDSFYIALPWAASTTTNMPNEVIEEGLTKDQGWMMAYNLFDAYSSKGTPNSYPYFMLYNKYTGTLRVFYYQIEDPGAGGELSFDITPTAASSPKYPFYHYLQYGIPMSHKDVQYKGNVIQELSGKSTFQQVLTPYVKTRNTITLKPGWYCFDLDWSAYNPDNASPFRSGATNRGGDAMAIDLHTQSNMDVTLAGTIQADITGTIETTEQASTSTSNGMNFLYACVFGGQYGKGALTALGTGDYLSAIFNGGMSLYNWASAYLLNYVVDDWIDDKYETEGTSTGTVNETLNGTIDLNGYIKSSTSNNSKGVTFSYKTFNASDSIGAGAWSLQQDPVVYVVNDILLGDEEELACTKAADGYDMGSEDIKDKNLRLVTFLDPTSIKLNLNTGIYKNIRNAKVVWTYGVYPNQQHGHTDAYRSLLDITPQEPVFIDAEHEGEDYASFDGDMANMKYIEYPVADMTLTQLSSTTKPAFYDQKGANYRYYGHAGNTEKATSANFFVVDPVVMLPTTFTKEEVEKGEEEPEYGASKFYDFDAPDFVVGVTLSFDYDSYVDGKMVTSTALFSKRFIPQVKSISSNEMFTKVTALRKYAQGTVHQTIGSLNITHGKSNSLLQHLFDTSAYIKLHMPE